MLEENIEMQGLLKKYDFSFSPVEEGRVIAALKLS
jgi:hypothetical protein